MQKSKISPKDDFMFKAIFTRKGNTELLEDLIESIIGRKVKCKNISKEARIGQLNRKEEKYGSLDIRVQLETEEEVDIEIQLKDKGNTINRAVHYASVLSAEQLKVTEDYSTMKPKIIIFLVNYIMFEYDEVVNESYTCLINHKEKEITKLHKYYYVELPKVNKIHDNIKLKRWILFLNEEWEELDKMGRSNIIEKAREEYEYLTGDEEIKRLNYLRTKALRDEAASKRLGLEEGLEKGLRRGKKEGKIEGKIEGKMESAKLIANSMKQNGIKISMIIKCTGLSRKEIEELK